MKVKTLKKALLSAVFAATVLFTVGNTTDAKAATNNIKVSDVSTLSAAPVGQVSGFKQIDSSTSSIKFTFSYNNVDTNKFAVQYSLDKVTWSELDTYCDMNGTYISGLQAGKTYFVRVTPYTGYSWEAVLGNPSEPFEVVTAPEGKPVISFKATAVNKINVAWKAVDGANTYLYQYYKRGDNKDNAKVITVNKNSVTLSKLAKNTEYYIYVYPARKSSSGYVAYSSYTYGYNSDLKAKPTKTTSPSVESSSRSQGYVYFGTDKIDNADGYQYEIWTTAKKAKKVVSKVGTRSDYYFFKMSHKALKKSVVYKARVRAYTLGSGNKKQFGAWSGWDYFTTNKECSYKCYKGKMNVTWTKISGADRYVIKLSIHKKNGYKKIATTKKNSITITKYNKKALKKGTDYYIQIIAQKKVGKKFVNIDDPYYYSLWYHYY